MPSVAEKPELEAKFEIFHSGLLDMSLFIANLYLTRTHELIFK